MQPSTPIAHARRYGSAPRFTIWCAALLSIAAFFVVRDAQAYAWMIRHGDTTCTTCHVDPSGSRLLNSQGRARGELLLPARFGGEPSCRSDDDGNLKGCSPGRFLWGATDLPPEIHLGADFRLVDRISGIDANPVENKFLFPRADFLVGFSAAGLRAGASLGYANSGSRGASLTRSDAHNFVSREHWLGLELDEEGGWLVRGGRMALPFGLRNVEDDSWVRAATRTNIDDNQQYGFAVSFSRPRLRGEIMGVLGNFQVRPDAYRERGYSGFAEYAVTSQLAIGLSSMVLRSWRDVVYRVSDYRQAHGLFARYAPVKPLVFLAEGDVLYHSLTWNGHRDGYAAFLQTDVEPLQGYHFFATFEGKMDGGVDQPSSFGAFGGFQWFFASHADFRIEGGYRRLEYASYNENAFYGLARLHLYL